MPDIGSREDSSDGDALGAGPECEGPLDELAPPGPDGGDDAFGTGRHCPSTCVHRCPWLSASFALDDCEDSVARGGALALAFALSEALRGLSLRMRVGSKTIGG